MAAGRKKGLTEEELERHIRMEEARAKRREKNEKSRIAREARLLKKAKAKAAEDEDVMKIEAIDGVSATTNGDEARGPFGWVAEKGQSWQQYRTNARIFGDAAFQRRLPAALRGPLPEPKEMEKNPRWNKLLGIAWDLHDEEHHTQSVVRRGLSPPRMGSQPGSSTTLYEPQLPATDADWLPFVTFWPSEGIPEFVVLSNRLYTPPPPPPVDPILREDCRYWLHESAWIPQWLSEAERRYFAFIPMKTPQGVREETVRDREASWYFKTHNDPRGDIGWYTLDWGHCESPGVNLWRIGPTLRDTVRREVEETRVAWVAAHDIRSRRHSHHHHWRENAPVDRVDELKAAMSYLLGSSGSSWELRGALVGFQRCLLEIRGFIAMALALQKAEEINLLRDNSLAAQSQSQKAFGRRDSRGVFVLDDKPAAEKYARYGVPVWYFREHTPEIAQEVSNRRRGAVLLFHGITDQTDSIVMAIRSGVEPPRAYLTLATLRDMKVVAVEAREQRQRDLANTIDWRAGTSQSITRATEQAQDRDQEPGSVVLSTKGSVAAEIESADAGPARASEPLRTPSPAGMTLDERMELGQDVVAEHVTPDVTRQLESADAGPARASEPLRTPSPAAMTVDERMELAEDVVAEHVTPDVTGQLESADTGPAWASEPLQTPSPRTQEETMDVSDDSEESEETSSEEEDLEETKEDEELQAEDGEAGKKRRLLWRKGKRHNKVRRIINSMEDTRYKTVHVHLSTFRERDAAMPEWWPYRFEPARIAALSTDESAERQVQLAGAKEYPLPQDGKEQEVAYKMPRLSYLTNAWSTGTADKWKTKEENATRAIDHWILMREHYLSHVEHEGVGTDAGFSAATWRQILKNLVYNTQSYELVERLGLGAAMSSSAQDPDDAEVAVSERLQKSLKEVLGDLKATRALSFDGHLLPARVDGEDWLSPAWKGYVVWELSELEFRYELLSIALWMRRWYPTKADLQAPSDIEYFHMVKDCWNDGIQGLRPAGNNWLCSENPEERVPGLRAFAELIRMWPRGQELLPDWATHWNQDGNAPTDERVFAKLEANVWQAYVQLYYDHRGRLPPLPHLRPDPPFEQHEE